MSDPIPPTDLVLQALHAIRGAVDETNRRLDQTNSKLDKLSDRVDQTNEKVDTLRVFTVQKLTDLNAKVDMTNERLSQLTDSHIQLTARFDNFLLNEGSGLVRRVSRCEAEIEGLKLKVGH